MAPGRLATGPSRERGIALITTLIMLSVVTLMAVAFLAVSRRERAAVTTSSDRVDARAMADAALQRAEAEIVSRVMAASNLLAYDLLVSTNYVSPFGFVRNSTNVANVGYQYADGSLVGGEDLLAMYRNLMVDPRAPVFVTTNFTTGEEEFRFYLDFNRNGRFETNGIQLELDRNGRPLPLTNFFVGDPEWIGVLRRPDLPHSGSNQFIGRIAYLVLPAGKTLDLNYVHNQSKRLPPDQDGYFRNQGVGSWELNLAAFLRDLNTNAWNGYFYRTNLANVSSGVSFDNALTLLRQRFRRYPFDPAASYNRLLSVRQLFSQRGELAFRRDGIDGYSDGPIQLGIERPYNEGSGRFVTVDDDEPSQPWPGADNPSQYFDPQELFAVPASGSFVDSFTNRLVRSGFTNSTYDRHTFYRLLGQLGTDSVPANQNRIHLNFDNRLDIDPRFIGSPPDARTSLGHATNFFAWQPIQFFRTAGDALLKAYHPIGSTNTPFLAVTNIPLWPTNLYSPAVHRALQLAANIFDATTNRTWSPGYPHPPSIFRPVFGRPPDIDAPNANGGDLAITNFTDISDIDPNALWNLIPEDIDEGAGSPGRVAPFDLVAGVPLIVGAKKGWPNFNEFALQTVVQATRKLELVKSAPLARPSFTNQLYTLGISNLLGIEFWNSYTQTVARPIELRVRVQTEMVLSNEFRVVRRFGPATITSNILYNGSSFDRTWRGNEFKLPILATLNFLPDSIYRSDGSFLSLSNRFQLPFEPARGFPVPTWRLMITNRVQAMLVDRSGGSASGRVIDYINLDNLNSYIDITAALFGEEDLAGQTSLIGSFWRTNRVGGIPEGVRQQIQASLGSINVAEWNSASAEPIQGQDKEKAVERFRQFMGLSAIPAPPSPTLRMQVPFSPARKLFQNKAWQVNDPLVSRMVWDLEDPARTNDIRYVKPVRAAIGSDTHNLGQINFRYRPWQRGLYSSADATDFLVAVKDPQVSRSDDWDFPTNAFPTIGWLGRVHRGTPWQTVYLKSEPVDPIQWTQWSGHQNYLWRGLFLPGTQPTNDWAILDLFTTAPNDNASRGVLSVNQSGLAAWSAVLSGVPVLTNLVATNTGPVLVEPDSFELKNIVDGINATRATRFGQRFNFLGEILATPELTLRSPYLRIAATQLGTPADPVVERIPQMVMSLLKRDEPRFVVYAFGQSLRPAPGSVVTDFGPYFQMPTNYTITGEYVTKTLMRLETMNERTVDPVTGLPRDVTRIVAVKESYNEVPPPE